MTTGVRRTQAERSEQSTTAILDAAADLVVEGGFATMTLAAIGDRAGYSRGLVTARFGSKGGLIDALIRRIVGRWSHRNVLPRTEGKPGLEATLIILDAIRLQAQRDVRGLRVLYALMFEAVGPDEDLRARFVSFHSTMRADIAELIRRGIEDGSVRPDVDAYIEAGMIVATLRGVGYQWLLDPDGWDFAAYLGQLIQATRERLAGKTRARKR
jgi:AcrR family transcriptional regulator